MPVALVPTEKIVSILELGELEFQSERNVNIS